MTAEVLLLLDAVEATALAGVVAVVLVAVLVRLPAGAAAVLAALLVVPAVVPLPVLGQLPVGRLVANAAALLPFLALPPAWGIRRVPAEGLRIAASLAAPGIVRRRIWLRLVAPWLLSALLMGLGRALAGVGLPWAGTVLLAVGVWLILRNVGDDQAE